MIDWPIKSDVRRKCPIFSELSSESIDRNILSGTVRKSGKDDICPWQWSDFRLFRPLKTDSRLNYRTKYRTLLLISNLIYQIKNDLCWYHIVLNCIDR